MANFENFFGNLTIDPDFFVILDLDLVENIGHPFWEFLDPNPDIDQLFNRFNKLFFDETFTDEQRNAVTLEWFNNRRGSLAARTWPAKKTGPIKIDFNERILSRVLRKEIIETLLHEMIHAYLMRHNLELESEDYHCENFERKRIEINAKANLNITINHDFLTTDRYIWRCRRICRKMAPHFGFAFLDKENKMPNYKTRMVLPRGTCAHDFERCTLDNDPKLAVSKWNCIRYFVKEIKNFVRIKTSHAVSKDPSAAEEFVFVHPMEDDSSFSSRDTFDDTSSSAEIVSRMEGHGPSESGYLIGDYITQRSPSRGYNSSRSTDNDFIEAVKGDGDPHQPIEKTIFELEDKFFNNFDEKTKTLVRIDGLHRKFAKNLEKYSYLFVCMVCDGHVDDDKAEIAEHLENCTGLSYALPPNVNDDTLPMYKLTSPV